MSPETGRAASDHRSLQIAGAFRAGLAAGGPLFGPWVHLAHATAVELMARLDFDFLLIDGEHAPVLPDDLPALLPSAELYGMPSVFRVRSHAAAPIKAALDAGVSGIMVPMVETAEEARVIVAASRYAPLGRRGIGPWRASGFYDDFDGYLARANGATSVILQIESRDGLENAERIAAVPGIQALYVGPADLAAALGLPVGDRSDPMMKALRRVAEAARGAGLAAGIDIQALETVPEMVGMGYSFFTSGSDIGFLQQGGRSQAGGIAACMARVAR